MDFGRVEDAALLAALDLRLPPDQPATARVLGRSPSADFALYVGLPQWNHPGFAGTLYPPGTRPTDTLRLYGRHFDAIELNTTYYGARRALLEKWRDAVPAHFRFAPKLLKEISHVRRLAHCGELLREFCNTVRALGPRLGPLFLLLPPDFGPRAGGVLRDFLREFRTVAPDLELAVELRDPACFQVAGPDLFGLFEEFGVIAVITDSAGRRDAVHMRLTASTAVVRFAGNRLHPSDFTRIDAWVERVAAWRDQGLRTLYLFLHQPEEQWNLEIARHVIPALNARCGTNLRVPEKIPEQGSLF